MGLDKWIETCYITQMQPITPDTIIEYRDSDAKRHNSDRTIAAMQSQASALWAIALAISELSQTIKNK